MTKTAGVKSKSNVGIESCFNGCGDTIKAIPEDGLRFGHIVKCSVCHCQTLPHKTRSQAVQAFMRRRKGWISIFDIIPSPGRNYHIASPNEYLGQAYIPVNTDTGCCWMVKGELALHMNEVKYYRPLLKAPGEET